MGVSDGGGVGFSGGGVGGYSYGGVVGCSGGGVGGCSDGGGMLASGSGCCCEMKTLQINASSNATKGVSSTATEGVSTTLNDDPINDSNLDAMMEDMMADFKDQPSQDSQSQVCNPTPVTEQVNPKQSSPSKVMTQAKAEKTKQTEKKK
ncbi:uncharacterized protein LOC127131493 [Lathyrus oleraceus]|uniref:uncharacterized protein LOC127131493 n=1 Tax=Pisum sativum TaxID=3888 RepID=UPI0021CF0F11|nr:uncharacterized protein LOC127131493 [Pisum sativum]